MRVDRCTVSVVSGMAEGYSYSPDIPSNCKLKQEV